MEILKFLLLVLCCKKVHLFKKIIGYEVRPVSKTTGTVIFFHGIGDTGAGLKQWIDLLMGNQPLFQNMRIIYPTAPFIQPHIKGRRELKAGSTGGKEINTWVDPRYYVFRGSEDLAAIHRIALDVIEIMKNESIYGVDFSNIFLGGFGMGGNIAMHIGYRYTLQVGGVFALSTFLKPHSAVYKSIRVLKHEKKINTAPGLFMCMAEMDLETRPMYTMKTFKRLKRLVGDVRLYTMLHAYHELKKEQLLELQRWIDMKRKTGTFIDNALIMSEMSVIHDEESLEKRLKNLIGNKQTTAKKRKKKKLVKEHDPRYMVSDQIMKGSNESSYSVEI